jgi:putative FmdB family regulatory protein
MPLYEFKCLACSREFETLVRPGTEPSCPACGGTNLERLISTSFSVKGNPGLSPAARRAVQKQQSAQHRDQAAFQEEIEKKHLDD